MLKLPSNEIEILDKAKAILQDNPEAVGYVDGTVLASAAKRKTPTKDESVNRLTRAFLNGGRAGDRTLSVKDVFASNELKPLIPQVVNNIITMPREPLRKLTGLYVPITVPKGQAISFPSIGAIQDAQDMGEAEQYPTVGKLTMAGTMSATAGKVGLKISFTQEAIDLSSSATTFNIVAMLLTAVADAFGRTKERKAAQHLLRQGTVSFDNTSSSTRNTSGRDSTGALNGTLTMDDIFLLYTEMLADGFNPDIIIFHPLAWQAFLKDDTLRLWAFQNGTPAMNQIWQNPTGTSGFSNFPQTGINPLQQIHDPFEEISTLATTPFPGLTPMGSLTPIVTPYASYTPASGNTPAIADLIIADSSRIGYLVTEEGYMTGEWADPETDIRNFKASEKYTFATNLNGAGIRIIRGVAVERTAFNFRDKFRYTPTINSGTPINFDAENLTAVF